MNLQKLFCLSAAALLMSAYALSAQEKSNEPLTHDDCNVYIEYQVISIPETEMNDIAKKLKKNPWQIDSEFIQAIYASGKYKVIGCSGIMTMNGQPARVNSTRNEYFPDRYSSDDEEQAKPESAETQDKNPSKDVAAAKKKHKFSSLKIPRFETVTELGSMLSVTPEANSSEFITLQMNPVIQGFAGYADYDGMKMAILDRKTVEARISLKNGETAMPGGSSSKKNDKEPGNMILSICHVKKVAVRHTTVEPVSKNIPVVQVNCTLLEIPYKELNEITKSNGQPSLPDKDLFDKIMNSGKAKITIPVKTMASSGVSNTSTDAVVIYDLNTWSLNENGEAVNDPCKAIQSGSVTATYDITDDNKQIVIFIHCDRSFHSGWNTFPVNTENGSSITFKMPIMKKFEAETKIVMKNGETVLAAKAGSIESNPENVTLFFVNAQIMNTKSGNDKK